MKVGDLVRVNHHRKQSGPVGLIIARGLSLPSEWWIVKWTGIGGRETIRSEHLKIVSS